MRHIFIVNPRSGHQDATPVIQKALSELNPSEPYEIYVTSAPGDATQYVRTRCQGDAYSCQRTSCRLHHIYGEVSQLVRNKLESYTFASICACEDTEADEKGEGKEAET